MSRDLVADTHALIWHVTEAPELSSRARDLLTDADNGNRAILVPSIVLVEVVYLVEKGRLKESTFDRIVEYVTDPLRPYHERPLDLHTVETMRRIPRAAVPDMPDRIVAATALALGLPLITVDARIRAAGVVPVVW